MTAVKICGITRREDAEAAAEAGAAFIGLVLWSGSPRAVAPDRVGGLVSALPATATPVGVFVNPSLQDLDRAVAAGIRIAQIHGQPPEGAGAIVEVIRAVSLAAGSGGEVDPDVADGTILLDAHDPERHGGTGRTIDWARAALVARARRVFLAGGLTPHNVRQAIAEVRPFAVDVSSGVESAPGVKDHARMRAFITEAKESV
jgi:phosphoribosylanthranilate isomerase